MSLSTGGGGECVGAQTALLVRAGVRAKPRIGVRRSNPSCSAALPLRLMGQKGLASRRAAVARSYSPAAIGAAAETSRALPWVGCRLCAGPCAHLPVRARQFAWQLNARVAAVYSSQSEGVRVPMQYLRLHPKLGGVYSALACTGAASAAGRHLSSNSRWASLRARATKGRQVGVKNPEPDAHTATAPIRGACLPVCLSASSHAYLRAACRWPACFCGEGGWTGRVFAGSWQLAGGGWWTGVLSARLLPTTRFSVLPARHHPTSHTIRSAPHAPLLLSVLYMVPGLLQCASPLAPFARHQLKLQFESTSCTPLRNAVFLLFMMLLGCP